MMSLNNKIIIIGGSIAGLTTAVRIKRLNENAEITLIEESQYVGTYLSGIPSYITGDIKKIETLTPGNETKLKNIYGINVLSSHKALDVNKEKKFICVKKISTGTKQEIPYDKLILACGNRYILPKIYKKTLKNIFKLQTINDAVKIRKYIETTAAKEITLIGITQASLTTADNFVRKGFSVSIITKTEKLLDDLDEDFNVLLKEELLKNGIFLYTNTTILDYVRNDKEKVSKLKLSNGSNINTHLIINFENISPNMELADKLQLEKTETGRIKISTKFETSIKDIYAVGNIAQTYNSITEKPVIDNLPGRTTQHQARCLGNIINDDSLNYNGQFDTKIFVLKNITIGKTGLNLKEVKEAGFNALPVVSYSGSHERFFPGSQKLHFKIIVDKITRRILGAQVAGIKQSIDKYLDILAVAIHSRLTANDLINLNLGYSPDTSPFKNPINVLGMIAENRLNGLSQSINIKDITFDENSFILDIRNKKDYHKSHIANSKWIPLNELRTRFNEIPREKNIYVYGNIGLQGYIAERMLKGNGFINVYNIEGGITSIKIAEKNI